MDGKEIAGRRMHAQHLIGAPLETPGDVVHGFGAVQAQDYGPAKWSVAQRTGAVADAGVDKGLAEGEILRTHALRPTWHFVSPTDIRWIQAATAPRVQARNAHRYRQLGLEGGDLDRSGELIARALEGGREMTRKEIATLLQQAGISTDGQRLVYILMNAELQCLICSGALRGKQHTYALVDERAPQAKDLTYEEALAELTLRYFAGHGPSTTRDFAAWASLRMSDIDEALAMVGSQLEHEAFDGKNYWFAAHPPRHRPRSPKVSLLQKYDEYIIGYRETRWILDLAGTAGNLWSDVFPNIVLLDGQIAGRWKRTLKKDSVVIDAALHVRFDHAQMKALEAEAERFGRFLGSTPIVEISLL